VTKVFLRVSEEGEGNLGFLTGPIERNSICRPPGGKVSKKRGTCITENQLRKKVLNRESREKVGTNAKAIKWGGNSSQDHLTWQGRGDSKFLKEAV